MKNEAHKVRIAFILKQVEDGAAAAEVCHRARIFDATILRLA
ncbi:hypothetical protein [Phyllobacterium sp. K27]